jgi:hypothetical protein
LVSLAIVIVAVIEVISTIAVVTNIVDSVVFVTTERNVLTAGKKNSLKE